MKLKSSNKFSVFFLLVLTVLATSFLFLQSSVKKKGKYPEAPMTNQTTTLDLIQITVNEKAYNKIKKKRDKAITLGILEAKDTDYVPATITFNGENYKAEIRLKGDWTTHLEGEKWSFRVKLKDDRTILGMRKFSLHHPKTRVYLGEWLYHRAMKRENLMGLRYNFVEGKIHVKTGGDFYFNKDVGIYALEETFDKRTIESNKRKESVIIKFSEDYWWNEVKQASLIGNQFGISYNEFMNHSIVSTAKAPITVFSESKVLEDSIMRNYFKLSKNLLEDLRQNKNNVSDVFDVKKLAMDNALTNLFGALHGTYSINVRFYYNPITSKLEPISFDGNAGVKLNDYVNFPFKGKERDINYLKELVIALSKVTQPTYIDNLINENRKELDYYSKILKTEFPGKFLYVENLRFNQNIMRRKLQELKKELGLSNDEVLIASKPDLNVFYSPKKEGWQSVGVDIEPVKQNFDNNAVFKVSRKNNSSSAYVKTSSIVTDFGGYYEVTINVKNSDNKSYFGLRIMGDYPSRVDAVFNLITGKLKDVVTTGLFEEGNAKIKPLNNGWYQCILRVKPNIEKLNIIFGPSDSGKVIEGWEGKSDILSNVFVTSPVIKKITSN